VRLLIQASAEEDILQQVAWYVEQGVPHIARNFHGAAMHAIEGLIAVPEAGSPRSSGNRNLAGLRIWPIKGFDSFWIYYLARPDAVQILRVLHSKRDTSAILEDQDVDEP
jgi:toxin ParE1/3/4